MTSLKANWCFETGSEAFFEGEGWADFGVLESAVPRTANVASGKVLLSADSDPFPEIAAWLAKETGKTPRFESAFSKDGGDRISVRYYVDGTSSFEIVASRTEFARPELKAVSARWIPWKDLYGILAKLVSDGVRTKAGVVKSLRGTVAPKFCLGIYEKNPEFFYPFS